jgi:hypothetical protein
MTVIETLKRCIGAIVQVDAPVLDDVSPSNTEVALITPLTLTGSNFTRVPTITFYSDNILIPPLDATNVVVIDSNTITCDSPSFVFSDTYNIRFSNPPGGTGGGLTSTLLNYFGVTD